METKPTAVRPEIQTLRAIAVLSVVIYHLWPTVLPGGFVGVDVFFVISGYLITSLLLREIRRNGRISLTGFWARRARRILPASLVVLFACAVATLVFVPISYWEQFFRENWASTLYFQNWRLAADAVNYHSAENDFSPFNHFWSLSAEEQFYLLWPTLIILAAFFARRGTPRTVTRVIFGALAITTIASLGYSIYATSSDPAAAYFVTPTRGWEFGAGGLLAFVQAPGERLHITRSWVSWLGLALIALTVVSFSGKTPFPSYYAAVPVIGTAAVIWAGLTRHIWASSPLLKMRPAQAIGDMSYSIYLWHWPFLIFFPFVFQQNAGTVDKIGILLVTVLAAWISKRTIEDPVRNSSRLKQSAPRLTFAASMFATVVVLGVISTGVAFSNKNEKQELQTAQKVAANRPACFGAAARDPLHPCKNPSLKHSVVPSPSVAKKQVNSPCTKGERFKSLVPCGFNLGAKSGSGVAIIGDSHAGAWRAAVKSITQERDWFGKSLAGNHCPFTTASKPGSKADIANCQRWNRDIPDWLEANPGIDTVFLANLSGTTLISRNGMSEFQTAVSGYVEAWKTVPQTVKHVYVIADNPKPYAGPRTAQCIAQVMGKKRSAESCGTPAALAIVPDAAVAAAKQMNSKRFQVIDLTKFFCDSKLCYPIIGGALVTKDKTHITLAFSESLGPYMSRAFNKLRQG